MTFGNPLQDSGGWAPAAARLRDHPCGASLDDLENCIENLREITIRAGHEDG